MNKKGKEKKMKVYDELHVHDIEGDTILVPEKFYIQDTTIWDGNVPFLLNYCGNSVKDLINSIKEGYDGEICEEDIEELCNFMEDLFYYRSGLERDSYYISVEFLKDEKIIEICIFSKDKMKAGRTFGTFNVGLVDGIGMMEAVDQGLTVRKTIRLPENIYELSSEMLLYDLSLCNYYVQNGYTVFYR